MINENELHKGYGSFWSGFYLGAIFAAGGIFLVGTKKGRDLLSNILDSAEDLEESASEIIDDFIKKANNERFSFITKSVPDDSSGDKINNVISKIQRSIPAKKGFKKTSKAAKKN